MCLYTIECVCLNSAGRNALIQLLRWKEEEQTKQIKKLIQTTAKLYDFDDCKIQQ